MWAAIQVILGGVLLLAGRRLYWLLAAGAGFILGYWLAQAVLKEQPENVIMAVALVVAVVFAVLAVVGQKVVIGLVGFIAGGIGLLRLLELLNSGSIEANTVLGIVVFIAGGILGAILLAKLFDLGLIILSSLVGAQIVLAGSEQLFAPFSDLGMVGLVVLMALGLLVQLGALRRH